MATFKAFRHWLEQHLWQWIQERLPPPPRVWVVMLSGGPDSLALAEALDHIRGLADPREVWVFHVHHGGAIPWRDEALRFCQAWANQKGWKMGWVRASDMLQSEAQCRQFRYESLRDWLSQFSQPTWVFVAHTGDDLLETRLLRLIRGVGPLGFPSMKDINDPLVRPFLGIWRSQIQDYLSVLGVKAWEDPSNQDMRYQRNWLRQEWLPLLEHRYPGSVKQLGKSLERLAIALKPSRYLGKPVSGGFRIPWHKWAILSQTDRYHQLALTYHLLGVSNYSVGHLDQVHKFLWSRVHGRPHKVGSLVWNLQDGWIQAIRPKGGI